MPATRQLYEAIDLRAPRPGAWPDKVPALTPPEAERAARRLWRFAMGETLRLPIVQTTGNRFTWTHRGTLRVNATAGWRRFVHDLSHLFVSRCNPGERPHSKFHARFEAKLIREVIRRGWLDGKLRDKPKAAVVQPVAGPNDKRLAMLARIDANAERWQRKADRARRALAKLQRRRRYYERAIAKAAP